MSVLYRSGLESRSKYFHRVPRIGHQKAKKNCANPQYCKNVRTNVVLSAHYIIIYLLHAKVKATIVRDYITWCLLRVGQIFNFVIYGEICLEFIFTSKREKKSLFYLELKRITLDAFYGCWLH